MKEYLNKLSNEVIGAAIEVPQDLGPGLPESSYEASLQHELSLRGISSVRQLLLPITYKGLVIPDAYRIDLLVDGCLMVELKTVEALQQIHSSQLLTYLRMSNNHLGLLINFRTVLLKDGIQRLVHNFPS